MNAIISCWCTQEQLYSNYSWQVAGAASWLPCCAMDGTSAGTGRTSSVRVPPHSSPASCSVYQILKPVEVMGIPVVVTWKPGPMSWKHVVVQSAHDQWPTTDRHINTCGLVKWTTAERMSSSVLYYIIFFLLLLINFNCSIPVLELFLHNEGDDHSTLLWYNSIAKCPYSHLYCYM